METAIPLVNLVAWAAVVACIASTVHCAIHVKRHARLFTSLTFFALSWAPLLPYYGLQLGKELPKGLSEVFELLPAYNGLLLTLAGGPLRREAAIRNGGRDPGIAKFDTWALYALYAMVLPHVISIPNAPDFLSRYHTHIVMVLGTGFTFLGFISILQGLKKLTERKPIDRKLWVLLTAVSILYLATELWYTIVLLPNPDMQMASGFKWAYAAFKIFFTALFLVIVVRQLHRRASRNESTVRKRAKRLKKRKRAGRRSGTPGETIQTV